MIGLAMPANGTYKGISKWYNSENLQVGALGWTIHQRHGRSFLCSTHPVVFLAFDCSWGAFYNKPITLSIILNWVSHTSSVGSLEFIDGQSEVPVTTWTCTSFWSESLMRLACVSVDSDANSCYFQGWVVGHSVDFKSVTIAQKVLHSRICKLNSFKL